MWKNVTSFETGNEPPTKNGKVLNVTRPKKVQPVSLTGLKKTLVTLYIDRSNIDDDGNSNVYNVTPLPSGTSITLDITAWGYMNTGQRLYAWWQNPVNNSQISYGIYNDKVEIYYCSQSPITMCYNPTAVDYFALPVKIGPIESSSCSNVIPTGTGDFTLASIKASCPTIYQEYEPLGVCLSPWRVCTWVDTENSICSALDSTVKQCINDGICGSGSTTNDAYACSGWFIGQNGYCAAINRGVYLSLNQDDASMFYQTEPYSEYAQYIHKSGDLEYAFAYDDYGNNGQSGYQVCTTNFLNVQWCPSG